MCLFAAGVVLFVGLVFGFLAGRLYEEDVQSKNAAEGRKEVA